MVQLLDLSVVVPAYNEEGCLVSTIERIYQVCSAMGISFEVLCVDDASTDRTAALLKDLCRTHPDLRAFRHKRNLGVAEGLKLMYREARGQWVAFLPADGQIDADQLPLLFSHRHTPMVFGLRSPRRDPSRRLWASFGFNFLVRLLWNIPINDVDSVTLFRNDLVKINFRSRGLCLPVEILVKGVKKGLEFKEVTVEHKPRTCGKAWGANPRVVLRTLWDLLLARFIPGRW